MIFESNTIHDRTFAYSLAFPSGPVDFRAIIYREDTLTLASISNYLVQQSSSFNPRKKRLVV